MNESKYYSPVYQISLAEQCWPQKNVLSSSNPAFALFHVSPFLRGAHINAFSTQHTACVLNCTESIFVFTDMCWAVWKHYMKPKNKTKEKHVEHCNCSFIYMYVIGMRRIKGCVDSVSQQWDVIIFLLLSKHISAVAGNNAWLIKMNPSDSN